MSDASKFKWAIVNDSNEIGTVAVESNKVNEIIAEKPLLFKTRQKARNSDYFYPNKGDKIRKITVKESKSIDFSCLSNIPEIHQKVFVRDVFCKLEQLDPTKILEGTVITRGLVDGTHGVYIESIQRYAGYEDKELYFSHKEAMNGIRVYIKNEVRLNLRRIKDLESLNKKLLKASEKFS